jgi:hypothetical protein
MVSAKEIQMFLAIAKVVEITGGHGRNRTANAGLGWNNNRTGLAEDLNAPRSLLLIRTPFMQGLQTEPIAAPMPAHPGPGRQPVCLTFRQSMQ